MAVIFGLSALSFFSNTALAVEPHYVREGGSGTWANCAGDSTQACNMATANANAAATNVVQLLNGTYTTGFNPANTGSWTTGRITWTGNPTAPNAVVLPSYTFNGKSHITLKNIKLQATDLLSPFGAACRRDSVQYITLDANSVGKRARISFAGADSCVMDHLTMLRYSDSNNRIFEDAGVSCLPCVAGSSCETPSNICYIVTFGDSAKGDTISYSNLNIGGTQLTTEAWTINAIVGYTLLYNNIDYLCNGIDPGWEIRYYNFSTWRGNKFNVVNNSGNAVRLIFRDEEYGNVWDTDSLLLSGSSPLGVLMRSRGEGLTCGGETVPPGACGGFPRTRAQKITNSLFQSTAPLYDQYGAFQFADWFQSDTITNNIFRVTAGPAFYSLRLARTYNALDCTGGHCGYIPPTNGTIIDHNTFIGPTTGYKRAIVVLNDNNQIGSPLQPFTYTNNVHYSTQTTANDASAACVNWGSNIQGLTSDYNHYTYYTSDAHGNHTVTQGTNTGPVGFGGNWTNTTGQDSHSRMACDQGTACFHGPAFQDSVPGNLLTNVLAFAPGTQDNLSTGQTDTSSCCFSGGHMGAKTGICGAAPDNTPPDSVHAMSFTRQTTDTYLVGWQNAGDDGNTGRAFRIVIGYGLDLGDPASAGNSLLNAELGNPSPVTLLTTTLAPTGNAGSFQTFQFSRGQPQVVYLLGIDCVIKMYDEAGNAGPANVISTPALIDWPTFTY